MRAAPSSTRRPGRNLFRRPSAFHQSLALLLSALLLPGSLAANPSGGVVTAGAAAISGGAGTLTIHQTSSRAIIHWHDFSIGAGELTRFVQPDAASATLNRVLGGNPSELLGSLQANGRVFLINPNGVLVGAGARIDAAGFLASTLDVADADFLKGGDLLFSGDSTAAVRNLGAINALGGDVFLIARKVENRGTIAAANGTAGLAGGSEVLLTTGGGQRVFVRAATAPGEVVNSGQIAAATAELKAAGGNAYALAVNNTGVIRATGAAERDGQVWLIAGTAEGPGARHVNQGAMRHAGEIVATNADGRGGFVETSGSAVELAGSVRTGAGGRWLIDPENFTVDAGNVGGFVATLNGGTAVTIEADDNIIFETSLVSTGGGSLTLRSDIDRDGTGTVLFNGGSTITLGAGGSLDIFYNPSSYATPTDFSASVTLSGGGVLTAYMWVHDVNQLQAINTNLGGAYALSGDIDASGTATWNDGAGFKAIGGVIHANNFTGRLNGQGHVISGLMINERTTGGYVGLFSNISGSAVIERVGLVDADISGFDYIGGLVGQQTGGMISQSYVSGRVSGRLGVGGLVGQQFGGTIANSYMIGSVTGDNRVGGLVGEAILTATIINSYASGPMTGIGRGLVGDAATVSIANSYWDTESSGRPGGDLGTGKTTQELKTASTYSGWNLGTDPAGNVWVMVDGQTRPMLAWEYSTTITNAHQLQLIGLNPTTLAASYTLARDLDLSAILDPADIWGTQSVGGVITGAGFVPIGLSGGGFTGTFDGQGHTISNLAINRPGTSRIGLFSALDGSAVIGRVGLLNAAVTGGDYVGGLVGHQNAGTLVSQSSVSGDVSGNYLVGGLVGEQNGDISGSSASGTVTGSAAYTGGLVGIQNNGDTTGSSASSTVTGSSNVGGLVGEQRNGTISLSQASGSVTGSGSYIGGLVGYQSGSISQSYASGSVAGSGDVGGLAGHAAADKITDSYYLLTGDRQLTASAGAVNLFGGVRQSDGVAVFSGHTLTINASSGIALAEAVALADNRLVLAGGSGAITTTAATSVDVGTFTLQSGTWTQNAGTLPAFSADDFRITGGTFIRVLGGDGASAGTAYRIADVYGLQGVASADMLGRHSVLAGDIDASGTATWNDNGDGTYAGFRPIGGNGDQNSFFSGTFDGQGYAVDGLFINRPGTNYVGLFGQIGTNAVVRNIGLTDGRITGGSFTGGLIGRSYYGYVSDVAVDAHVRGYRDVGGAMGYNWVGYLGDAHASGTVEGHDRVGGLLGMNDNRDGPASAHLTADVTVIATGSEVGGLIGTNWGTVSDSHATGAVTGAGYVGGFIGLHVTNTLSRNYATGNVTGGNSVGGFVGRNNNSPIVDSYATGDVTGAHYVGGLVGENTGALTGSHASGHVSGVSQVGGLVGGNGGSISDSYYLLAADRELTATGGSVNLIGGVKQSDGVTSFSGHTLTITASDGIDLSGAIGLANNTLVLDAGGAITSTAAASVGTFILENGTWTQNAATLPAFAADDFRIAGGTFLRVLGGDGASAGTAYRIADVYGLQGIGSAGMLGHHYALANDIDAGGTLNWNAGAGFVPIGSNATFSDASRFTGTFDGQGRTISGLVIDRPLSGYVGLFGYVGSGAQIRDVGLVGGSLRGGAFAGGLAGISYGTITQSYATGVVSGTDFVGGLAGGSFGAITQSYATGVVSGTDFVGGLAGGSFGAITQSYATGVVSGTNFVGGLVGVSEGTITQSYAAVAASGTHYVGGLVGSNDGTIAQSYWDTTASGLLEGVGTGDDLGLEGKTTAQMKQLSSFAAWGADIDDQGGTGAVWRIYDGHTGPLLRAFLTAVTVTGDNETKTYDGTTTPVATDYTLPGGIDGSLILGSASYTAASKNAGTYTGADGTLAMGGLYSGQQGYDISYAAGTLTVDKATLTLTATADTKTYDGTTASGGAVSVAGVQAGDSVTDLVQSFDSRNAGGRTLAVTGYTLNDGNGGDNYTVDLVGAAGSIGKAALTITANAGQGKTYGADDPTAAATAYTLTSGSLVSSDSFTGGLGRQAGEAVGSYAFTQGTLTVDDGNGGNNYDLTFDNATGLFVISPAGLTAGIAHQSKIYGQDDPQLSGIAVTLGGLVNRFVTDLNGNTTLVDDTAAVTTTLAGLTRAAGENVGNYAIGGASLQPLAGASAGNYHAPVFTGSPVLTITPATLAASIANQNKVYGNGDPALSGIGVTLGALVNRVVSTWNGSVAINDTALTASLGNLTRAAGENAGDYAITGASFNLHGAAAANYAPALAGSPILTITRRPITLTANAAGKVYGDADPALGVSIMGGSLATVTVTDTLADVTGTLSRETGENVGGYDIALGSGAKAANYDITFDAANNAFSITPAPLTITASGQTKIYGDAFTFTGTEFAVAGLKNGETVGSVTFVSDGAAATAGVGGSPYAITASGATGGTFDASNYTIVYEEGAFTVTPKSITVTASGGSSIYGQSPVNPGFTASGLVNDEDESVLTGLANNFTITRNSNADTYTLSVVGTLTNGNYTITERETGTWTVTPKDITVTANGGSSIYGQSPVNPGFTASGLVNDEDESVLTGLANNFTITRNSNADTYTLSVVGTLTNGNYNVIARNNGTWTISPKDITVTANGGSSTYGQSPVNPGFTASGLVNDQDESVLTGLTNNFAITRNSNADTYTLSVVGTLTNGNYTITERETGTWIVTPKDITVTANGGSSIYGQSPANPGFTASGLVNDEDESVLTGLANNFTITRNSNADTYTLSVVGTLTNGNYNVTARNNGTWTISPKDITVTANGGSSTYGQSPANPGFTASGLVNDEDESVLTGLANNFAITRNSNADTYTLSVVGALTNGNYTITERETGTWTVSPKDITVAANGGSSIYGQSPTNPGFTASGLVNDQDESVLTGLANNFTITRNSNAGTYTLAVTGTLTNGNYTLTARNDGIWTVSPKDITVTANGGSSIYGQSPANPGFIASGLVNDEDESVLTGLANNFAITRNSNADTYTLSVVGTLENGNYNVTARNNGTWIVNRAALLITADDASRFYGEVNPAFTARFTGLVNGETGAVVDGLAFTTPATSDSPIGDYAITPFGAQAANYDITYAEGTLQVLPLSLPGGLTAPVVVIDGRPTLSSRYAAVEFGGRRMLVKLGDPALVSQDHALSVALAHRPESRVFGPTTTAPELTYRDDGGRPAAYASALVFTSSLSESLAAARNE